SVSRVCPQPVRESHVSSVHGLPSSQLSRAPVQEPPVQVSPVVHASPSSQGAALGVCTQPVSGRQASSVQTLPSSQLRGDPTHLPPAQVSPVVHASPSSQGFVLKPVNRQTPAASQAASLQMLPAGQAVPGGALRQAAEQQSPSTRLPSSHSSNASRKPLPQISIVFPATEKRSV